MLSMSGDHNRTASSPSLESETPTDSQTIAGPQSSIKTLSKSTSDLEHLDNIKARSKSTSDLAHLDGIKVHSKSTSDLGRNNIATVMVGNTLLCPGVTGEVKGDVITRSPVACAAGPADSDGGGGLSVSHRRSLDTLCDDAAAGKRDGQRGDQEGAGDSSSRLSPADRSGLKGSSIDSGHVELLDYSQQELVSRFAELCTTHDYLTPQSSMGNRNASSRKSSSSDSAMDIHSPSDDDIDKDFPKMDLEKVSHIMIATAKPDVTEKQEKAPQCRMTKILNSNGSSRPYPFSINPPAVVISDHSHENAPGEVGGGGVNTLIGYTHEQIQQDTLESPARLRRAHSSSSITSDISTPSGFSESSFYTDSSISVEEEDKELEDLKNSQANKIKFKPKVGTFMFFFIFSCLDFRKLV